MIELDYKKYLTSIVVTACLAMAWPLLAELDITEELLSRIEQKHNKYARERVVNWQNLISEARNLSDQEKLRTVNEFFNSNVQFISDLALWGKDDYWAHP